MQEHVSCVKITVNKSVGFRKRRDQFHAFIGKRFVFTRDPGGDIAPQSFCSRGEPIVLRNRNAVDGVSQVGHYFRVFIHPLRTGRNIS